MNLSDFYYELPEELIGQEPIEPRDRCHLLVVNKNSGKIINRVFSDLTEILDKKTVLVLNDTKVFPARLFGTKDSGGRVEILLLKQTSIDSYDAIGKGKFHPGTKVSFSPDFSGEIKTINEGEINISFNKKGTELIEKIDQLGKTPLPPYIHSKSDENDLRIKYQTVYANKKGSAAAPTAGLHFTSELLQNLKNKGVQIEKVTLHVGLGTFKPVTEEQISSRTLHTESFSITNETSDRLNTAKMDGKKIIAVGTTTCRVLETQSDNEGNLKPGVGETNIFIQPGYKYKFVNGLITNFHLPSTSLLMLVTALVSFPNSPIVFTNFKDNLIGKAYQEAIKRKYKFFSFGDAMMIL